MNRGFGIRTRLVVSFGALLTLTAIIGASAWWNVRALAADHRDVVVNNLGGASALAVVERGLWELRFALPNYLQGDVASRSEIRSAASKWEAQIDEGMQAYVALALTPDEQSILKDWRTSYEEYRRARPHYFELVDQEKNDEAKQYRRTRTNPPAAAAVRALGKLIAIQNRAGNERMVLASDRAAMMSRILVISLAFALGLGTLLALLIGRDLITSIERVVQTAGRVARGDLSDSIVTTRTDEVGQLLTSISRMIEGLRTLLSELQTGAQDLNAIASQLSARASQQSLGTAAQAASLGQAATTLAEMRTFASHASTLAQSVLQGADRSVAAVRASRSSLAAATATTAELSQRFRVLAKAVQELGGHAGQANEVVSTVDSSAVRAHLLALNAMIEATRVGEAGKGFRIVAEEMRQLAASSKDATVRIRTILGDIGQAVDATVASTQQGGIWVASGAEKVNDVTANIQLLHDTVADAAHATQQIEVAARQQLNAIEEIGAMVQGISSAAQESADGAKEQDAAARELTRLSHDLSAMVARYRMT